MATVIYQVFVASFGGGLDGIRSRLDHIQGLGADALYLTPIFEAPSNHKYDATSFDVVDAAFGGEAAFARLVTALKERNLGLILDGVFNHVGERHPWTRERPHFFSGSVWRGHASLPQLALGHPEVRQALFGDEGVVARWTRRGATGWRLDCANDLGPEVCALAATAARRAGAVDGIIGELMAFPAGWAPPGGLDGYMNYWLRSVALGCASGKIGADQAQSALDRLAAELPPDALAASWNILSSHDTPRLETMLDGDAARVGLALALQFLYPGRPMIYYGEELAMRGGPDPDNRKPMVWDEEAWDRARLQTVKALCTLRHELPALRTGRYVAMPQPGTGLIAFARTTGRPAETLLVVANPGPARRARLFLPLPHLYDALPLHDLLSSDGAVASMDQGCAELELPAFGVRLLAPRDAHAGGYRFFK
jgi:alpha-glucosidase